MKCTEDVNTDGLCCCKSDPISYAPCAGCGKEVQVWRDNGAHWKGQHWHLACAFEAALNELGELKSQFVSDETFAELMESGRQALEHARGERDDLRVTLVTRVEKIYGSQNPVLDYEQVNASGVCAYRGGVYVRPLERGVRLKDITTPPNESGETFFDFYLDNIAALVGIGSTGGDGDAELEIIIRRLTTSDGVDLSDEEREVEQANRHLERAWEKIHEGRSASAGLEVPATASGEAGDIEVPANKGPSERVLRIFEKVKTLSQEELRELITWLDERIAEERKSQP